MNNYQNVGLLGSDGFVGQTICKKLVEIRKFNRKNMQELLEVNLDFLIVSAVSAEKWRANIDPSSDLENIERLIRFLKKIQTKKLLLISTIDVMGTNHEFNEDSPRLEVIPSPYGLNRNFLERRINEIFEESSILRLPGLFGPGLKKNLLFDIINKDIIDTPPLESTYQYLFAPRIIDLIDEMVSSEIKLFNAATEPIKVRDLIHEAKTSLAPVVKNFQRIKDASIIHYKMKTKYREGGYLMKSSEVLNEIGGWIKYEKNKVFS